MDTDSLTDVESSARTSAAPVVSFTAKHAIWLFLIVIAAQLVLGLVTGIVGGIVYGVQYAVEHGEPMSPEQFSDEMQLLLMAWGVLIGGLGSMVVAILLVRRWARGLLDLGEADGIAWTSAPSAASLALAAGMGVLLSGTVLVLIHFFPIDPAKMTGPLAQLSESGGFPFFVFLTLGLAFAPVFEEFLFRGALFAAFARSWGVWASGVITTVLFMLVHAADKLDYPPGFIAVGLMGVACLLLRLRYKSLKPAIACHFTYNLSLLIMNGIMQ